MPLYTYVTCYRGATYIAQKRRSNFKGWPDWATDLPDDAFPPALRQELSHKVYEGSFDAVPNRMRVWRKALILSGSELVVVAIETVG
jgi:hypothetical protein